MLRRKALTFLAVAGAQWHNIHLGFGFAHGYQDPYDDAEKALKSMGVYKKRKSRYNPLLYFARKDDIASKIGEIPPPQTPVPGTSIPRFLANNNDDGNEEETNELCSEYLISFLEGTTDAKDNCEGILNAYIAADCASLTEESNGVGGGDDDHDDYIMGGFYAHFCCSSLKMHYYEYCDEDDYISNWNLLVIMSVMLLCECVKSIIKKNQLNFLPEAGGCILVGTLCGFIAHVALGFNIDALSFDNELFLCVLLPPIIFEAALSVNKREFRRHRLAILMFAIAGTLFSTFVTGIIVHYASAASNSAPTLPMLDSLTFGALISSIDPVAILSVLSSLGLGEKDTIFIIVFGESLLNDGIAITLFKSFVACFDDTGGTIQADQVLGVVADFIIVCFGSAAIGIACGVLAVIYFWIIGRLLHPSMEVGSFFIWALIPYYVCDAIEWSGIVGIVAMGFFMDIYITPKRKKPTPTSVSLHVGMGGDLRGSFDVIRGSFEAASFDTAETQSISKRSQVTNIVMRRKRVRLSAEADRHVRFVAHLLTTLAENAIFAYLGLFLLSSNYDWNIFLIVLSIVSCVMGRVLMVLVICWSIWHIHILRQRFCWQGGVKTASEHNRESSHKNVLISNTVVTIQEWRSQVVLVLAGLRGAVSLALVENVPIYNGVTGQGSEYKPQLKAMTSSAIIFTMFIFGGSAYYILQRLGVTSTDDDASDATEKHGQRSPEKVTRDTPDTKSGYRNPVISQVQLAPLSSSESAVSSVMPCNPCAKDVTQTSSGDFMSPLQQVTSQVYSPSYRYRSTPNEMQHFQHNGTPTTRTGIPTSPNANTSGFQTVALTPHAYIGGKLSPVGNSGTWEGVDGSEGGVIHELPPFHLRPNTYPASGRPSSEHGIYPASGRPGSEHGAHPAPAEPSSEQGAHPESST